MKRGEYLSFENCNLEFVAKEGYNGPTMGIPNDIRTCFTNLNDDEIIDAIITFDLTNCGGGNMNTEEIRILVLSEKDDYIIEDKYFTKFHSYFNKGLMTIDKASYGMFIGSYYQYKNSDARCCPSIRKSFTIDFQSSELLFQEIH